MDTPKSLISLYPISQPKMAPDNLHILAEAGIVQMRPDGQKRLYSLRKEAFDQLEAWVAGYRRHWQARLDRFGAALERRQGAADPDPQEKS
jgi:DNA-binding transcriptional ArsR family regulator